MALAPAASREVAMHARETKQMPAADADDSLGQLLRGYRFSVCQSPAAASRALAVRQAVYVDGSGYALPVPDPYDARSWFLLAEDLESGLAVGSMRLTPRFAGPLEAEESFTLPPLLRVPH